jgi:spectrin alpha
VQLFSADADEEESWLHEKISVAAADDAPDTLAGAQALLKKHEAFETDLADHGDRIAAVCARGQTLIGQRNYQSATVEQAIAKLRGLQGRLHDASQARKAALGDRCTSLQFGREADSIIAWIADKEPLMASDDFGRDLPAVQALMARQATFDSALASFDARISALGALKDDLLRQSNSSSAAILQADAAVTARWKKLLAAAEARKVCSVSPLPYPFVVISS